MPQHYIVRCNKKQICMPLLKQALSLSGRHQPQTKQPLKSQEAEEFIKCLSSQWLFKGFCISSIVAPDVRYHFASFQQIFHIMNYSGATMQSKSRLLPRSNPF